MIEINDLQVVFSPQTPMETYALRGVSITIPDNQFVTVIGSNGAGKSTLLSVLAGEIIPLAGSVRIAGRDVTHLPMHGRADVVARVFQDPRIGVCPTMTIEENLALAFKRGSRRGLARALKEERRQRFRDRLKILGMGLEDRLGDQIGLLSGGQRQAVSLLMATLSPSQILLLDEHTAALDPKMAAFVIGLTRDIVKEFSLTTLMVTHSMPDALSCGDRTIMMHDGQVAVDIGSEQRSGMSPKDFLSLFSKNRECANADESLLSTV